jgi:hypothetical protein
MQEINLILIELFSLLDELFQNRLHAIQAQLFKAFFDGYHERASLWR